MVFHEFAILANVDQHESVSAVEAVLDLLDGGFFYPRFCVIHNLEKAGGMLHRKLLGGC
jgi:hypothetical protein